MTEFKLKTKQIIKFDKNLVFTFRFRSQLIDLKKINLKTKGFKKALKLSITYITSIKSYITVIILAFENGSKHVERKICHINAN